MKPLSPKQRQFLKSRAHRLHPVVMIGNQGLTPAVLKEIEHALNTHELIKIKAASAEAETRQAWVEQICHAAKAMAVQQIGKVVVIYRPAATPVIKLP